MVAFWIVLLAFVVFFMYIWTTKPTPSGGSKCNTCPGKNVSAVE